MKKMIIMIIILLSIFIGMIIYKNILVKTANNVNVQEIEKIEEYISKIYMWKEVTKEALPEFENINDASDLWTWEVVKKQIEKYEMTYEEIVQTAKEIYGKTFNKQFPKEGNESIKYDVANNCYLAEPIELDTKEDSFILNNIEKKNNVYTITIIEYLEDYSNENSIIIRNTEEQEIGRVSEQDGESKIKEIVKENINRFSQKRLYIKIEDESMNIEKVEKIQV